MASETFHPKLNPRAVELLRRVQEQLRKTPTQFDMRYWFAAKPDESLDDPRHSCGTTACIAGWVAAIDYDDVGDGRILWGAAARLIGTTSQFSDKGFVGSCAAKAMGMNVRDLERLFYVDGNADNEFTVRRGWPDPFHDQYYVATLISEPEARAIAMAGVAIRRIDHFIEHGE